jgi:hypothetical protein
LRDPREFEARFGFQPVADRQLEAAVAMLDALRVSEGATVNGAMILALESSCR